MWILVILLFAADGQFAAKYERVTNEADCRAAVVLLQKDPSPLAFTDGTKPAAMAISCESVQRLR